MNGLEGPSLTEMSGRLRKRLHLAEFPIYDKRYNPSNPNNVMGSGDESLIKGGDRLGSRPNGDGG